MESSTLVTVVTTVAAATGAASGLAALWISIRADRRSVRTEKQAEQTKADTRWGDLITAAHSFIGANVQGNDLQAIVLRFRVAGTDLIDGLPEDKLQRLDQWLDAERLLMTSLFNRALLDLGPGRSSVDEIVAAHDDAMTCASALVNNLHRMRKIHPSTESAEEIAQLLESATANREAVINSRSAFDG